MPIAFVLQLYDRQRNRFRIPVLYSDVLCIQPLNFDALANANSARTFEMEIDLKLIAVCFVVATVTAYILLGKLQSSAKYSPKHYQTVPLLTDNEQGLFWRLQEAVGRELLVAPQVVFGAFLKVKGTALVDKTKARNAVAHNRGDFLVCNRDFEVVALVELDDSTHDKKEQKALDKRRDELMKAVGVKAIRYRNLPEISKIRSDLGL